MSGIAVEGGPRKEGLRSIAVQPLDVICRMGVVEQPFPGADGEGLPVCFGVTDGICLPGKSSGS